jgi:hypothetical protein
MTSSEPSGQALAGAADDWEACCSGGDIRSAARCLWALQSLGQGGLAAKARWLRRLGFLLVCVLAVPAAHLPGAAKAAAAVTSRSPGTVQANVNAVSCSASNACTAVAVPKGATRAALDGISCVAGTTTRCMAVGSYSAHGKAPALAERWDGRVWTLLPVSVAGHRCGSAPSPTRRCHSRCL